MMSLQQLRVLLAVRDEGSFNRAATAMQYGVQTVAHHMNALEKHLAAKLVERGRAGATLTPLGESFADDVCTALALLDRAEQALADQRDAGVVTLRIGTFASMGARLLPATIAALQQRTSVRVEVVEAEPTEIVRMLQTGEVAAGLIYDTSADPAFTAQGLQFETLLSEPYRVMVSASSDWAQRTILDFADLIDVAWVCSRSRTEASDRVLQRVMTALGAPVRELIHTDDLYMIHGLVEEGLGLALTTAVAMDSDFDVVLRPAVQDLGERHVIFAARAGRNPPAVEWLRDILRARAAAARITA